MANKQHYLGGEMGTDRVGGRKGACRRCRQAVACSGTKGVIRGCRWWWRWLNLTDSESMQVEGDAQDNALHLQVHFISREHFNRTTGHFYNSKTHR